MLFLNIQSVKDKYPKCESLPGEASRIRRAYVPEEQEKLITSTVQVKK